MAETKIEGHQRWSVATIGGSVACTVLALGLIAVLAVADAKTFEDAEFSGLYQFTLKDAYSRFTASDAQVRAGGQPDPLDDGMGHGLASSPPGGAAMGLPGRQAQLPGGFADKARRLQAGAQGGPAAQHAYDDGGPHTAKGNEYLQKREYDKAVAEFRLAIQENPARTLAHHSLGDTLRLIGQNDEAVAAYREVLKLNPAYYCCYTHIGDIESARKNQQAADQAYAAAINGYKQQLSQGGPTATIAKYHLASLYSNQNRNLTEALSFAEDVARESPDQLAYVQLVAQLYEKVGRTDDAIAMYEKLIQMSPQHAESFRLQQQRLRAGAAQ